MLKKVMFFLMAAYSAARLFALSLTISTQPDRLPVPIYIVTGITVALGMFLLCKRILYKVKMRQVELYYMITGITAVFNLICMKISIRLDTNLIDLLVIGTVLDVVVSVTLIVLAEKERQYIKIPVTEQRGR